MLIGFGQEAGENVNVYYLNFANMIRMRKNEEGRKRSWRDAEIS
jgi:hypothetical protein